MWLLTPVFCGDVGVILQNSERRWLPGVTKDRYVTCVRYLTAVVCCEIEPARIVMFVFGWVKYGGQVGINACIWNDVTMNPLCHHSSINVSVADSIVYSPFYSRIPETTKVWKTAHKKKWTVLYGVTFISDQNAATNWFCLWNTT